MSKLRPTTFLLLALALATIAFATVLLSTNAFGPPPNYSLIEPGLYLGGNGPKPPDATAVLSLTPHPDDYTAEVYASAPIIVSAKPPPALDWLSKQVHFIDTQHRAGRTIYVHCDAGIDRSASVVIAYIMWRDHRTLADALSLVKAKRPIINPDPVLIKLLSKWESSLSTPEAP